MSKTFVKALAIAGYVSAMLAAVVAGSAHAEPDLSGVWLPDIKDQKRQETANTPPWKPEILEQVQHLSPRKRPGDRSSCSATACRLRNLFPGEASQYDAEHGLDELRAAPETRIKRSRVAQARAALCSLGGGPRI